jgi:DNA-binding NarL/FixJ family response regulator
MKKILKTKILLVDDHRLMRAGLRSILEKQPDMEILGEAQNGLVALQLAKEIAHDLNISVKTVETFRHKIEDKLSLSSIAELTKYAIREGLTSL